MADMFDILEFCMNDSLADQRAIREAAEATKAINLIESVDTDLADMIYTTEAMHFMHEAQNIESVSDLDDRLNKLLAKPKGSSAFVKVFKILCKISIAGMGAAAGVTGYMAKDQIGSAISKAGDGWNKANGVFSGVKDAASGYWKGLGNDTITMGKAATVLLGGALVGAVLYAGAKLISHVVSKFSSKIANSNEPPEVRKANLKAMINDTTQAMNQTKDPEQKEKFQQARQQLQDALAEVA